MHGKRAILLWRLWWKQFCLTRSSRIQVQSRCATSAILALDFLYVMTNVAGLRRKMTVEQEFVPNERLCCQTCVLASAHSCHLCFNHMCPDCTTDSLSFRTCQTCNQMVCQTGPCSFRCRDCYGIHCKTCSYAWKQKRMDIAIPWWHSTASCVRSAILLN